MRHLVLSRKGFDATAGGGTSPILVDYGGVMVSLPIPESPEDAAPQQPSYGDLFVDGTSYAKLISDLYRERGGMDFSERAAHLDPDLVCDAWPRRANERRAGWRGLFGTASAAAGHLRNQGVDAGDLFLFFGRFGRAREDASGAYRFDREGDFHAIYGYLEVACVLSARSGEAVRPPAEVDWEPNFPHFLHGYAGQTRVFVASEKLSFDQSKRGWGTFHYREDLLRLTAHDDGATGIDLRDWQLPECFADVRLTYNPRPGEQPWPTRFRSAGRGQEFVCAATTGVQDWLHHLFDGLTVRN